MTWTRRRVAAMMGASLAIGSSGSRADQPAIVVGGKNFTEQYLMADLTAQLLRAGGATVRKRAGLTTNGLRRAQSLGEVDLCWEYVGTSLVNFNGDNDRLDPSEALQRVMRLDGERGLVWLAPSRVNNTYALAVRQGDADRFGTRTLSDLSDLLRRGQDLRFGVNSEFATRPDGLRPLSAAYGFPFGSANTIRIDPSLIYHALREGQVDIGLIFATDGRVPAYDLAVLDDDRHFFPDYTMAPVIRRETLERQPDLREPLAKLASKLDNAVMARLNSSVDVDRRPVEDVAAVFLHTEGLI